MPKNADVKSKQKQNKNTNVTDKQEQNKNTNIMEKQEQSKKTNVADRKKSKTGNIDNKKDNKKSVNTSVKTNKNNSNSKTHKKENVKIKTNKKNENRKNDATIETKVKKNTAKKEDVKQQEKSKNKEVVIKVKPEQDAEEIAATTTEKENVKLIKFEEIKNIFKKKKKIPKEELKKINKPVFHNILVAIVVMIYFIFLILGFLNIEGNVYQTDLKVFSICILFLAIFLLEKAYKEDSGRIAIFGIEMIVIAIITLGLIYVKLMLSSHYINIVLIILYIVLIYYVIKSIVIYNKGKKKYFIKDVKEMINTEE